MPAVIKAGRTGEIQKRLSTVDLADHLAQARAFVEAAERQASRIIADAKHAAGDTLERARKQGHEEGYNHGHEEGTEVGRKTAYEEATARFDEQQAHLVTDMERVVNEFDAMKEEIRVTAERDILTLAVHLARKLTYAIGEVHRESACGNLERAIALVGLKSSLTVRVHPKDIETMTTFASGLKARLDHAHSISLVADDSLAPGGCVVRNELSEVDASIDTQIEEAVVLLIGREHGDE